MRVVTLCASQLASEYLMCCPSSPASRHDSSMTACQSVTCRTGRSGTAWSLGRLIETRPTAAAAASTSAAGPCRQVPVVLPHKCTLAAYVEHADCANRYCNLNTAYVCRSRGSGWQRVQTLQLRPGFRRCSRWRQRQRCRCQRWRWPPACQPRRWVWFIALRPSAVHWCCESSFYIG